MRFIDVFNGDADGVCALRQLRLAEPRDAELVTGVKRDIELLGRVDAGAGDTVTVLDISLDRNRDELLRLLANGAEVWYFDHHNAASLPHHERLHARIDASPTTCTSLLVNRFLGQRHAAWAVTGAFGDAVVEPALELARAAGFGVDEVSTLQQLGMALNYNAYGEALSDLVIAPAELYRLLERHETPFDFIRAESELFQALCDARQADMQAALAAVAHDALPVHVLPDCAWSRRVIGELAHHLAATAPQRAHAVLAARPDGSFRVSLRTPSSAVVCADHFCRLYGGAGRRGAAGIDALAPSMLEDFSARFRAVYTG